MSADGPALFSLWLATKMRVTPARDTRAVYGGADDCPFIADDRCW
jgi:hypothetical protein